MRHDLLILALTAVLVGCTPDDGDDTGDTNDTDTGADTDTDTGVDTDTDTGVDTDTDTGVAPFCGDGNVDEGEQCDLGTDNGPDGDCSATCDWNGWVTCDLLAGPFVTLDTNAPQPNGTFHVNGRFDGQVALESTCAADATQSVAVQFTLPAAGTWKVSTANSTNTAHTAISLRTDCDDRAEIACGVDNAEFSGAAQAFIEDGAAGSHWVALVQLVDGDEVGWHLSLSPIDGIADAGEACDDDTPCDNGSICTDTGVTSVCVPDGAPVITSATIAQVEYYDYQITVTGTDANRDVNSVFVPTFEDEYGDIWGDDDEETPIPVLNPQITWSGDTFTARWVQSISYYETGMGALVDLDVQVADRTGDLSNTVNVVYPEPITNQNMPYIGDPCDVDGFPRYCDPNPHADPNDAGAPQIPGLSCTWNETNTATSCQDKNINPPPVMDGGEMWWEGPTAYLRLNGYDTVHATGVSAIITAVYTDTTTATVPEEFLSNCTWDHGDFACSADIDVSGLTKPVDHLSVLVEDNGYPSATTTTPVLVDWVDPIPAVEVGYNQECDLHGWESVCEEPYICSPTLSGIPACLESEPPVLHDISGVYTGGFFTSMAFTFEGSDPNADWSSLVVEQTTGWPRGLATDSFDSPWMPDPFGLQAYEGDLNLGFGTWIYRTWLEDSDGNTSETKVVSGVPTQLQGETCNTGTCTFFGCSPPTSYCDIEAGDTCSNRTELAGTVKVCEIAEAPTLDSVIVQRIDSKKFKVLFTGTDPNGDAVDLQIVKYEDGVPYYVSTPVDSATPMFGQTSFSSSFTVVGTTGTDPSYPYIRDPHAEVVLEITLQDWAFLESETVTVTVPPVLEAGEECTGDPTIGTCWEATECISGECFGYEPQLSSATLAYKTNGREAEVTITGFDDKTGANHQLKEVHVTIAGHTTSVTSIPKTGSTAPTWSGNQFTYKIPTLRPTGVSNVVYQVGTGYLVGEQFVTVRLVDIGGFSDTGTYFINPIHKGLGDTCDTTGVANICHAGLVCDGTQTPAVCENDTDPAKVCGGVPVIVASSDVVAYDIPATGTTAPATPNLEHYKDYASCGSTSNNPNGTERVVQYTATQDGNLRIKSASTDANTQPGYLFVRVNECVDYEAIVDCSNLTPNGSTVLNNEVEVPVLAGDVVYVTVDGPSFKKGAGTVTFSYDVP